MSTLARTASRSVVTSFLMFGVTCGVMLAQDLSRYRDFQLGADLIGVAKQAGVSPSEVKVIVRRPALIQEIAWSPQPLGPSSKTESVREVVFTFYNGQLFRIVAVRPNSRSHFAAH